jgi:hypothetical protein
MLGRFQPCLRIRSHLCEVVTSAVSRCAFRRRQTAHLQYRDGEEATLLTRTGNAGRQLRHVAAETCEQTLSRFKVVCFGNQFFTLVQRLLAGE